MDNSKFYNNIVKKLESLSIRLVEANDCLYDCEQIVNRFGSYASGFIIIAFNSMEKICLLNLATILDETCENNSPISIFEIAKILRKNRDKFLEKKQLENLVFHMKKNGISNENYLTLEDALIKYNNYQKFNYKPLNQIIEAIENLSNIHKETIKAIKVHRDKRISHNDKTFVLNESTFYGKNKINVNKIKELIKELNDFLGNILLLIGESPRADHDMFFNNFNDVIK